MVRFELGLAGVPQANDGVKTSALWSAWISLRPDARRDPHKVGEGKEILSQNTRNDFTPAAMVSL